jgi:hypothetical protein
VLVERKKVKHVWLYVQRENLPFVVALFNEILFICGV